MKSECWMRLACALLGACAADRLPAAEAARLQWSATGGVVWPTAHATVLVDRAGAQPPKAPHQWTDEEAALYRRAFDQRKAAGRGQARYLTIPWQAYGPKEWNTSPPKDLPPRPPGAVQRW